MTGMVKTKKRKAIGYVQSERDTPSKQATIERYCGANWTS